MRREEETQAALEAALVENKRLRAEIELLKNPPAGHSAPVPESASNDSGAFLCPPSAGISEVTPPADKAAKVALFRSLFRGREDVYAERWRMKNGDWGYRPAGLKNWEAVLASKPEDRRKVDRQTRTLYPLTDEVIRLHLSGKKTVGIYPLLLDETCWLLAADFDKSTWQEDALAFVATSRRLGLSAYLERSRSGNGGHVWIFFERPLPAAMVRKVGCAILTQTMEARHHLGLDSYDRFFPNQDTLPKGGFGNLIALPLQWMPRQEDKSVFVDDSLCPYPDQWLASVRRVPADQVDWIVNDATRRGQGVGRNRANDHRTGRGRGRGDQPYEWEPGSSDTCVAFSGVVPAGFAAAFRLRVALAIFAASLRFLAEALAFLVAAALTAASLRFFAAALAFRVAAALFAAALRSVAFFMARSIAERQRHAGFGYHRTPYVLRLHWCLTGTRA